MVRPMIRMSQMAASVESRGINLMHSLFFLKATSSEGKDHKKRYESSRDAHIFILNTMSPVVFPSWRWTRLVIQDARQKGWGTTALARGRVTVNSLGHPALPSGPDPRRPLPGRGPQGTHTPLPGEAWDKFMTAACSLLQPSDTSTPDAPSVNTFHYTGLLFFTFYYRDFQTFPPIETTGNKLNPRVPMNPIQYCQQWRNPLVSSPTLFSSAEI